MNIPLTSLCPIDWAVYADFCAENERWKAEVFSRKVSKSLRKFYASGTDPRAVLYSGSRPAKQWSGYGPTYRYIDPTTLIDWGGTYREGGKSLSAYLTTCFWTNPKFASAGTPLCSVKDLPERWQTTRLAFKFFKLLNRRATGIPDRVLEGVDG